MNAHRPPVRPALTPARLAVFILFTLAAGVGLVRLRSESPLVAVGLLFGLLAVSIGFTAWRNRGLLTPFLIRCGRITWAVWATLYQTARAVWRFYGFSRPRQNTPVEADPAAIPASMSLLVGFSLLCGLLFAILLFFLDPLWGFGGLVVVLGLGALMGRMGYEPLRLFRVMIAPLSAGTALRVIPRRLLLLEWALVAILALTATHRYLSPRAQTQYSGWEAEWLTSSAYSASVGLRELGRIPLWQPYLEYGEPLVENPFSFLFNPFSSGPTLLFGAQSGLLLSVELAALIAGFGGWFLARMLDLPVLARLLLAALLIGKGNMHAMINFGYFQLGISQAYFPWVIGAAVALFRLPDRHWPVVATALAMALLFFAGNLYYVLPIGFSVGVLALVYVFRAGSPRFDWRLVRRLALAALLTILLCAVQLLPVVANFDRLANHPDEIRAGWAVRLWDNVLPLYVDDNPARLITILSTYEPGPITVPVKDSSQFYYSFVVPLWFGVFLLLIPLYRPRLSRLWMVGLLLLVLATLWGAGEQPLFLWLYRNIPLLRQWRFVGRALAVGSFWLAVLVALRAGAVWDYITRMDWTALGMDVRPARFLRRAGAGVLLTAASLAAYQVIRPWDYGMNDVINVVSPVHNTCLRWLRDQHPSESLAVWQGGYYVIEPFLRYRVRTVEIQADYGVHALPSTIGRPQLSLVGILPEFGLTGNVRERSFLEEQGYRVMPPSPPTFIGLPCLYQRTGALPYAFTAPRVLVATASDSNLLRNRVERSSFVESVTPVVRHPDQLVFAVRSSPAYHVLLAAQERAYPGWRVLLDGQPAALESVAGFIGVSLPMDGQTHVVVFEYRPPLVQIGGIMTLAGAALSVWLLRRRA